MLPPTTVPWSSVAAGLIVAVGAYIVLNAFGLGVAFIGDALMEGEVVLGLLLWSGLVWIAVSFLGGYVAAWSANAITYPESLFLGLVLWGSLTSVVLFLPPSTMALGTVGLDVVTSPAVIASVTWFVAGGGLVSLVTTVWGTLVGSRVAGRRQIARTEQSRAA